MATKLLSTVDEAMDFVNKASNDDQKEVELLSAKGYKQQTFAKLVTKIDDEKSNVSEIPMLGLGTWLSKAGKVAAAVEYALKIGYRHVDGAAIYGNEPEVGQGIAAALKAGIKREDIFITSKLWNTKHDPKDVVPALQKSLKDLGLKYVDLYLIHWPLTLKAGDNNFPKKPDGSMDFGRIVPLTETWKGMQECIKLGLAKHIGISNFNEAQIADILKMSGPRPAVLQCEGHPFLAQNKLRKYCEENKILLQAYSPLGNPARPAGWDHSLERVLDNAEMKKIADELGVTVADVCIRYQIDRGVVVIPKSVTPSRIKSNFEVWDFKLNEEQIKRIEALDKKQRYGIPTIINDKGKRVIRDGNHPFWPWEDTPYSKPSVVDDEKKEEKEEVELLSAKGYKQQTFVKLVTKIDDQKSNVSEVPMLGLGTWLSKPGKVAAAVEYALKIGYRHVDGAAIYGNEPEVGQGIAAALKAGIKREDIFITSKLWNTKHDAKDVVPALKKSLKDLGLEYVDLYLIHWPLTLKAGDDNFPKKPDGSMDFGRIVPHTETWTGMQECIKLGLAKHIGISNFNEEQIDKILAMSGPRPTVLQCEGHPFLAQNELRKYCEKNKMILQAYSPLGNPARPAGWDHSLERVLDNAEMKKIADELGVTVADVCIRYQIDRGVVVIPKSVTPSRIKSNFEVWDFKLNEEQLKRIEALDKKQRYGIPTIVNDKGKRIIRDGAHPEWPWKDTIYN